MIKKRKTNILLKLIFTMLLSRSILSAYGTPAGTQIKNGSDQTQTGQVDTAGDVVVTWTNGPPTGVTSNQVIVVVSTGYAVVLTTVSATDQCLPSGTTAYIPYIVRNGGNANDTFSLSASTVAGQNWSVWITKDDDNDGQHDANETTVVTQTSELVPETSYYFFVSVFIPHNSVVGSSCTVRLVVKSQNGLGNEDNWPVDGNDTVSDDVNVICSAANLVVVKSTDVAYARPGSTITYTIIVTNIGSAQATNVVIKDKIPDNCEYESGSIKVNNVSKSDEQDNDGTHFDSQNKIVVVQITDINPNGSVTVEFKVKVK
ncbi:MAG: DUF11 domain-containing protein [Endomicrobia bacterium]|nr:DUF11 domain-containing protein [Endomicrobiia bacterium]